MFSAFNPATIPVAIINNIAFVIRHSKSIFTIAVWAVTPVGSINWYI
tara:strand:+ start:130 stop:270 length:141 start_codon:yes stop_codon:yes gene_type:complete